MPTADHHDPDDPPPPPAGPPPASDPLGAPVAGSGEHRPDDQPLLPTGFPKGTTAGLTVAWPSEANLTGESSGETATTTIAAGTLATKAPSETGTGLASGGAGSDGTTGTTSGAGRRAPRAATWLKAVAPGAALAAVITLVATYLGGFAPLIGAPVFAIVLGIVVAVARPPGSTLRPGITFTSKRVLKGAIIVFGFGLSLEQVVHTGADSLPVLLGSLAVALLLAWLVGRALRLPRDTKLLIGVGTAICGASAIAATDAVIEADETDVSYAIATVFTFNVIAVLSFPSFGHLFGMSQHAFGLWAGTAINDTSSVVAASRIYGQSAAAFGIIVKLTRTLAIIPICLVLAVWCNRREQRERAAVQDRSAAGAPPTAGADRAARVDLRRIFPLFILGFVAAVAVNSSGLVPDSWHHGIADLATWMITAALAAIGLSTRPREIRRAGVRPILLGGILWASVGLTSLGLELATGVI